MVVLTTHDCKYVKEVRNGFMTYEVSYEGPDLNGGYFYRVSRTTPDDITSSIQFSVEEHEISCMKNLTPMEIYDNMKKMVNCNPFVLEIVFGKTFRDSTIIHGIYNPLYKLREGIEVSDDFYTYRKVITTDTVSDRKSDMDLWDKAFEELKESDLYDGRFD